MRTHAPDRATAVPVHARQQLIQILLPLRDNEGRQIDARLHAQVKEELAARFGGLTAYSRTPAEGRWNAEGEQVREDVVVYEVIASRVDRVWWKEYRESLEQRFRQDEVLIRSMAVCRL